ncbi:unnamed protein product [Amoebophrya sp. A25]|nr:unnamed protein product [Amoebophrya sp. A25]|eukprot:GSA25T00011669001.1
MTSKPVPISHVRVLDKKNMANGLPIRRADFVLENGGPFRLSYTLLERSDAPPSAERRRRKVIFLHGWLQHEDCWLGTAKNVCYFYGYDCLLIEFPWHGRSTLARGTSSSLLPRVQDWHSEVLRPILERLHWTDDEDASNIEGDASNIEGDASNEAGANGATPPDNIIGGAGTTSSQSKPHLTFAGCSMGAKTSMSYNIAYPGCPENKRRFIILGTPGQAESKWPLEVGRCYGRLAERLCFAIAPTRELTTVVSGSFLPGSESSSTNPLSRWRSAAAQKMALLSISKDTPQYGLDPVTAARCLRTAEHTALVHGRSDLYHAPHFEKWADGRDYIFYRRVGMWGEEDVTSPVDDSGFPEVALDTGCKDDPRGDTKEASRPVSVLEYSWRTHETTCSFIDSMKLHRFWWFWGREPPDRAGILDWKLGPANRGSAGAKL